METIDVTEYRNIIAKRINELRTEHDMSMEEFGKILNVTKTTISRWESGSVDRIRTTYISTLSKRFNVSPGWLLGLDVPKTKTTDSQQQLIESINSKLVWLSESKLEKLIKFIDEYL